MQSALTAAVSRATRFVTSPQRPCSNAVDLPAAPTTGKVDNLATAINRVLTERAGAALVTSVSGVVAVGYFLWRRLDVKIDAMGAEARNDIKELRNDNKELRNKVDANATEARNDNKELRNKLDAIATETRNESNRTNTRLDAIMTLLTQGKTHTCEASSAKGASV